MTTAPSEEFPSSHEPMRVLIGDDHPAMRVGLRGLLEADGIEVCAEAGDAGEVVDRAVREHPDLCVIDVRMPGGGIAAAAEVVRRLPDTRVVMLSVSMDEGDIFDALKAGASGYLLKDINPARLSASLRGVMRGEAALSRALTARLIEAYRLGGARRRPPRLPESRCLTGREGEVLELLVEGRDTRSIAEQMGVAPVTARRHISEIVRKLGVADRDEAVALVKRRAQD